MSISEEKFKELKAKYITGEMSVRALAKDEDVSYTTLQRRVTTEKWPDLRKQSRRNVVAKAVNQIENKQAKEIKDVVFLADEILSKLKIAISQLDRLVEVEEIDTVSSKSGNKNSVKTTRKFKYGKGLIDRKGIKELSSALKDLKEIKTGLDEETDTTVKVIFQNDDSNYAE